MVKITIMQSLVILCGFLLGMIFTIGDLIYKQIKGGAKRMNIKKISNWIFIIGMLFLIAGMICQVVGL